MDFQVLCNPLYALPVVAVVICALLFYAFGCKAPVQPPSSEEIEIKKKTRKKKEAKLKLKERQPNGNVATKEGTEATGTRKRNEKVATGETKAKQPNGNVANKEGTGTKKKKEKVVTNETKKKQPNGNVANKKGTEATGTKKKNEKVVTNESKPKPPATEIPVQVEEKKKIQSPPTDSLGADDSNDSNEGWVRIVPKKLKKARALVKKYRDEKRAIGHKLIWPRMTPYQAPTTVKTVTEDLKQDNVASANAETSYNKMKDEQDAMEQSSSMQPSSRDLLRALPPEIKARHFSHPPYCIPESESSESAGNDVTTAHQVQKLPKKRKKKKVSPEPHGITLQAFDNSASEAAAPVMEQDNILAPLKTPDELKRQFQIRNSFDLPDMFGPKPEKESVEAKGSNVAFDELQGTYPDANQKRKKRSRRDH